MKALQRFEKIIEAVRGRIEEEVSSLIGERLELTLQPGAVVTKEDFSTNRRASWSSPAWT